MRSRSGRLRPATPAGSSFNSKLVSKFINCLMYDGKKSVATRVFYDAMTWWPSG